MAITQTLALTCVSQDLARNCSQVRILWQSTQTGESRVPVTRTATYRIRTNAGTWRSYSVGYTLPENTTCTVLDTTVEVPHQSDGTALVEVQTQMEAGQTITKSASLTLEPIAQHSEVSATNARIGGACTITVQRKNSRYAHSLRIRPDSKTDWRYINSNGELSDRETVYDQDVVHVILPESFYDSIPTAKHGTATVQCRTWVDGEKCLSDTAQTTFHYTADEAVCKPSVLCTVTDSNDQTVAVTGDASILVRYLSDAVCDLTPQIYRGAALHAEPGVRYLGQWYYGSRVVLPELESGELQLGVQDSRGYTTLRELDLSAQFVPYVLLTANAAARRESATGDTVLLSVQGNCYTGNIGQTPNAFALSYRIGEGPWTPLTPQVTEDRYTVQAVLTGLDYESTYRIQVQVSDSFTQLTRELEITPSVPVFDWGREDFAFHVPLVIQGSPLADFVVEQGSQEMVGITWHWSKWKSGKAECYGCRQVGTLPVTTAWNGMYCSATMTQSYPAGLFAAVPDFMSIRIRSSSSYPWVLQGYGGNQTQNGTGSFCVCATNSTQLQGLCLAFSAIGRWK